MFWEKNASHNLFKRLTPICLFFDATQTQSFLWTKRTWRQDDIFSRWLKMVTKLQQPKDIDARVFFLKWKLLCTTQFSHHASPNLKRNVPHVKLCLWIMRQKNPFTVHQSLFEKKFIHHLYMEYIFEKVKAKINVLGSIISSKIRRDFLISLTCSIFQKLRNSSILCKTFSHKWKSESQVSLSNEKDTIGGRLGRWRFPRFRRSCNWGASSKLSSRVLIEFPHMHIYLPHKN